MRHEDDLRAALRTLEREAPDPDAMLRRITGRTRGQRAGRRLMTAVACAAAVITIAGAAVAAPFWIRNHDEGSGPGQAPLSSVPPYYMALLPASGRTAAPLYAVVRSTTTGRTLATIRPPAPYITFTAVTGAADDRTFVLTARTAISGGMSTEVDFYEAHFSPAGHTVSLMSLTLPGVSPTQYPNHDYIVGDALSPDGTQLAVASENGPAIQGPNNTGDGFGQIAVYSLAGGTVRTWTVGPGDPGLAFGSYIITWSRTGLVFDWNGGMPEYFPGEYLLSTSGPGGSLLADSKLLTCGMDQDTSDLIGYLTPDAATIIVALGHPVARGHILSPCSQPVPPADGMVPQLEEFSAATGKATGVIYAGRPPLSRNLPAGQIGYAVYWSSNSGSVLVMSAYSTAGRAAAYGVVSRGVFRPIPGAPRVWGLDLAF
jgi:hypothetical protein